MAAVRDVEPPASFPLLRSEGSPREVGRSHGMHDGRVTGFIQTMEIGHRRIEGEHIVERERGIVAVEPQGLVAAQPDPAGVSNWSDGRQTIERTAEDDGEETRVTARGLRKLRHIGPGKQNARAQHQFTTGSLMRFVRHDIHLR